MCSCVGYGPLSRWRALLFLLARRFQFLANFRIDGLRLRALHLSDCSLDANGHKQHNTDLLVHYLLDSLALLHLLKATHGPASHASAAKRLQRVRAQEQRSPRQPTTAALRWCTNQPRKSVPTDRRCLQQRGALSTHEQSAPPGAAHTVRRVMPMPTASSEPSRALVKAVGRKHGVSIKPRNESRSTRFLSASSP